MWLFFSVSQCQQPMLRMLLWGINTKTEAESIYYLRMVLWQDLEVDHPADWSKPAGPHLPAAAQGLYHWCPGIATHLGPLGAVGQATPQHSRWLACAEVVLISHTETLAAGTWKTKCIFLVWQPKLYSRPATWRPSTDLLRPKPKWRLDLKHTRRRKRRKYSSVLFNLLFIVCCGSSEKQSFFFFFSYFTLLLLLPLSWLFCCK